MIATRGPGLAPLLLAGAACLLTACWTTRDEGQALRRDVDQMKRQLSADIEKVDRERAKLQNIMEQATALLTRNSADVGAQVERIQAATDRLSGKIEELQRSQDELKKSHSDFQARVDVKLEGLARESTPGTAPAVPEDKEELFKTAQAKLSAGDHQEARRLLRHFADRFPNDSRIDKAQLMLGDSYFAEQKFAPAIVEYKKIIEQHKQSSAVPDALYKIGMSFYQLKFCGDAELFLSQLLKRHRGHAQAARAQKVLGLIKRYRRDRNVCRP